MMTFSQMCEKIHLESLEDWWGEMANDEALAYELAEMARLRRRAEVESAHLEMP